MWLVLMQRFTMLCRLFASETLESTGAPLRLKSRLRVGVQKNNPNFK